MKEGREINKNIVGATNFPSLGGSTMKFGSVRVAPRLFFFVFADDGDCLQ